MKTAASITLSRTWWKREVPEELSRSAAVFARALGDYEKAQGRLDAAAGEGPVRAVEKSLDELTLAGRQVADEARSLARAETDRRRRTALVNTEAVMGRPLAREITAARGRVRLLAEEIERAGEEDIEEGGAFASPEAHADYLRKWAPRIKRAPVNFAIALPGNRPEEMRFHFHRRKDARGLANLLRKETGARKVTFGVAGAEALARAAGSEAEGARTLGLMIEGRQIPGLEKRVKRMLKALGVAQFSRVKIHEAGAKAPRAPGKRGAAPARDAGPDAPGANLPPPATGIPDTASDPTIAATLARLAADPAQKAALDAEAGAIQWLELKAAGQLLGGLVGVPAKDRDATRAALARMRATKARIDRLAVTHPEAALEARRQMRASDRALGDGTAIDMAALKALQQAEAAAKARLEALAADKARIEAMPDDTDEEKAAQIAAARAFAADRDAAEAALGDASAGLAAGVAKYSLGQALETGLLSPLNNRPLPDASAAKLVAGYARHPKLAHQAMKFAADATHPEAIAEGLARVTDGLTSGFADADGTRPDGVQPFSYARMMLYFGGEMGGDYFERASAYVARGGLLEGDPFGDKALDVNGQARNRATLVAKAMIGADGRLDPGSDAALHAIDHMAFSPHRYTANEKGHAVHTMMLARHMVDMRRRLADPDTLARANAALAGVTAPEGAAGRIMVNKSRRSAGKANAAVTAGETREAVVSAIMTPVYQGDVGTCFATAGLREIAANDPARTMGYFAELASSGRFTPANGGEPIPAETRLPKDGHPLARALEYAVATAAARDAEASQKRDVDAMMAKAVVEIDDQLDPEDLSEAERRAIFDLVRAKFRLRYDPTLAEKSEDGQSTKGVYVLFDISGRTPLRIADKDRFAKRLASHAVKAFGVKPGSRKAKRIARACRSKALMDAVDTSGRKPWMLDGGGSPGHAYDALFGGDLRSEGFLGAKPAGQSDGDRAEALLTELVKRFRDNDDEMMALATDVHAFNGLAHHPSLDRIKGATDAEIAQNIETHLKAPARRIAATPIAAERAAALFDKGVAGHPEDDAYKAAFEAGVAAHRPTGPMTAAEVNRAVRRALRPYLRRWQKDMLTTVRDAAAGTDGAFSETELRRRVDAAVEAALATAEAGNRKRAIALFRPPEVVIAHCNWGDPGEETHYVIMADPITGAPMVFEKVSPGNGYTEAREAAAMRWEETR